MSKASAAVAVTAQPVAFQHLNSAASWRESLLGWVNNRGDFLCSLLAGNLLGICDPVAGFAAALVLGCLRHRLWVSAESLSAESLSAVACLLTDSEACTGGLAAALSDLTVGGFAAASEADSCASVLT